MRKLPYTKGGDNMANLAFYGTMLSTEDVGKMLNVSKQAVSSYIRKGLLSATDLSSGSGRPIYGINEMDVIDFKMRMKKSTYGSSNAYRMPTRRPRREKKVTAEDLLIIENEKLKNELRAIKGEVTKLNEELLNITIRLEELTK
jgi:DNA-binding transcriptional MerR regulator